VVHALLIAPYLVPVSPSPAPEGPVDQEVVFLLPPDQEAGQRASGDAVDWSGLVGTGGSTRDELPKEERPEEVVVIPVGTEGQAEPTDELQPGPPILTETALTEVEVDSVVERDPTSAAPVYPPRLLERNVEGSTFVHYVVDTTGRVDTMTIQVVRATHPQFAASVREALALMKFRPAIQASRKVRQWVEQNFSFRIVAPAAAPDTT
jgi:TonB family protein